MSSPHGDVAGAVCTSRLPTFGPAPRANSQPTEPLAADSSSMSLQDFNAAVQQHLESVQSSILYELNSAEERLGAKLRELIAHQVSSPLTQLGKLSANFRSTALPSDAIFHSEGGNTPTNGYCSTPRGDGPIPLHASEGPACPGPPLLPEQVAASLTHSQGLPRAASMQAGQQASGTAAPASASQGAEQSLRSRSDIEEDDKIRLSRAQAIQEPSCSRSIQLTRSYKAPQWAKRLMSGTRTEIIFGLFVLANGITIGYQTEWAAHNFDVGWPVEFFFIDLAFTIIFTVELGLRLTYEGAKNFYCRSKHKAWAYADTFIVLSSLLEVASEVYMWSTNSNVNVQGASQIRALRIVRLTRLVRILRLSRVIRFVRALRTMVHQLLSAMKSLFWAVLLLMLIIYLFAILFTQAVSAHAHAMLEEGYSMESLETLREHWSSIPVSMLSLYMSITGGISWVDVIEPLNDVGTVYTTIFVGYIILAQLAVLNVLTGVFCQNAIDAAAHDAELVTQHMLQQREMYVKRLKDLFVEIDVDNSGSITLLEFQEHLLDPRVQAYFESLELDSSDVWTLFKLIDTDHGNRIELEEFVAGALKLRGAAKCVDLAKLTNEHNWLAKKITRFMRRTEDRLKDIQTNNSPMAFLYALSNSEAPDCGATSKGLKSAKLAARTRSNLSASLDQRSQMTPIRSGDEDDRDGDDAD